MKVLSLFCFVFPVGVALSGCQQFRPESLSAMQGAAALESRSLVDPHLKEFLERNLDRELSECPPAGVSPWLPSITFDVPIETAGKRGHRVARARELSEAARLNIATTAWQVRSRLRAALLDWTSASRRQELLRQQQSLQEKIVAQ